MSNCRISVYLFIMMFFGIGSLELIPTCRAVVDFYNLQPIPQRVLHGNPKESLLVSRDALLFLEVSPEAAEEAKVFSQQLEDLLHRSVKIIENHSAKWPRYAAFLHTQKEETPKEWPLPPDHAEGYALSINSEGFAAVGFDRQGLFYALQTIFQLLIKAEGNESISSALIVDWPDIPNRAIQMNLYGIRRDSDLVFFKRLLSALSSLKYNNVFFQFDFALPGPNSPFPTQIGKGKLPLSDDQVRELCEYARRRHLEVNLAFQFGGHCVWFLAEPAYRAFGEQNRNPLSWENANWSPLNTELWKVVEDLVTHQINLCQPKRIHIAHDEMAYGEFNSSESSQKAHLTNEELAALSLEKLRKIIPAQIDVIAWCDMFIPDGLKKQHSQGFTASEKMMQLTPKEIALALWFYSGTPEHTSALEYFKKHGRQFWVSTFPALDVAKVCYYGRRYQAEGVLGTHWYQVGSWLTPRTISNKAATSVVATAAFSWNTGQFDDLTKRDTVGVFRTLIEGPEIRGSASAYKCLDLSAKLNFPDPMKQENSLLSKVISTCSIKKVFDESIPFKNEKRAVVLAGSFGDEKELPVKVSIPVGKKIRAVHFWHTCGIPGNEAGMGSTQKTTERPKIGSYRLKFAANSKIAPVDIPLEYRWNIQDWNNIYSPYNAPLAWLGAIEKDIRVQAQCISWTVPGEEEVILESVEMETDRKYGIKPILLGITLEEASGNPKNETSSSETSVVINKEDFEYPSTQALQKVWNGFEPVRLEKSKVKNGSGSLAFTLPATTQLLRYNIGQKGIKQDISKGNRLSFWIRTDEPAEVSNIVSALYFGNDDKYWYVFVFNVPGNGKWKKISIPLSCASTEGSIPEKGGMSDLDTLMFSFWRSSGEPTTIFIDDFVLDQNDGLEIFNKIR